MTPIAKKILRETVTELTVNSELIPKLIGLTFTLHILKINHANGAKFTITEASYDGHELSLQYQFNTELDGRSRMVLHPFIMDYLRIKMRTDFGFNAPVRAIPV